MELKPISPGGVAKAILKAETYRYLNEAGEAESICRDILAVDPQNQAALRLLGLAIIDQFTGQPSDCFAEAETIFQHLTNSYERLYYTGVLYERRAKAQLKVGRSPHILLSLFEEAMDYFEEAEKIRPPDNDDSILRWNRCARLLQSRLGSEWRRDSDEFDAGDSAPI